VLFQIVADALLIAGDRGGVEHARGEQGGEHVAVADDDAGDHVVELGDEGALVAAGAADRVVIAALDDAAGPGGGGRDLDLGGLAGELAVPEPLAEEVADAVGDAVLAAVGPLRLVAAVEHEVAALGVEAADVGADEGGDDLGVLDAAVGGGGEEVAEVAVDVAVGVADGVLDEDAGGAGGGPGEGMGDRLGELPVAEAQAAVRVGGASAELGAVQGAGGHPRGRGDAVDGGGAGRRGRPHSARVATANSWRASTCSSLAGR
jgi:hypothetical protein